MTTSSRRLTAMLVTKSCQFKGECMEIATLLKFITYELAIIIGILGVIAAK
jgi:hypothetical protein